MVTRIGDSFVSRVGASLLTAVGLPDLITRTTREYRDLAVSLAQDPARLLELRARLDANRRTHPLFDAVLYTRHLEQAYEAVHVRRMAGLVPDEIVIVDN
jgi:predicted O-linked N-acetylglucosamine transferase (SPINDLY family)